MGTWLCVDIGTTVWFDERGLKGAWAGGTIAPEDTALLNNGASVTGNVTANGTLSLTNTGTLNLTGTTAAANTIVLDMTTSVSTGLLRIRSGTGVLRIGSSGNGTLTMNGGLVVVSGSLSKKTFSTINLNAGGTLQIGVGGTTGVLLGGDGSLVNNGTLIFNRSDDSTYSGVLGGSGAVVKQGDGALTLTGSSTYTGENSVNGGQLVVNGQLGNTSVTVNAAGLLGGSGTILGDVTVGSSGTISPGKSPGILTVGSLSLLADSHTAMEITGDSTSLYDQIMGTGAGGVTYGGTLELVLSGSYADLTTFHLFSNFASYTGNVTAIVLNVTGEYAGLTFSDSGGVWTSTETLNQQQIVFSTATGDLAVVMAVPEPSTWAMALTGLACGGSVVWRRRKRA